MAVNNNIVSKPISLREVAKLIGYGGNDLGTLCTHKNINMWAKYKPFRRVAGYNSIDFRQDYDEGYDDRDVALKASNYGLTFPVYTSNAQTLVGQYTQDLMHGWAYLPPSRSSDPKTLGDFINYNSKAHPFVANVYCSASSDNDVYKVTTDGKLSFMPMLNPDSDKTQLHISDFNEIGTPTFGILLYKDARQYLLKANSANVEFDSEKELGGFGVNASFYAYPVLCDQDRNYMRLIPCCKRYEIQRVSSQMAVEMKIDVTPFGNGYQVSLQVKPLSSLSISGTASVIAPDGTVEDHNIPVQQFAGGTWQSVKFGSSAIPQNWVVYTPAIAGGYSLRVTLNDKYVNTFPLPSNNSGQ